MEEKKFYELERQKLAHLAAAFRRRHQYMCRNRDGAYSSTEINMALFASDTALSLAEHLGDLIVRIDEKHKAEQRYAERCRIGEMWEHYHYVLGQPGDLRMLIETDGRDALEILQESEFKEILWKKEGYDPRLDKEVEERAEKAATHRNPWKHQVSHLKWYENASREDIMRGEDEDYANLIRSVML